VLTGLGVVPSKVDPGLYIKETAQGKILLLTYVDDLLIAAKSSAAVESVVIETLSIDYRLTGSKQVTSSDNLTARYDSNVGSSGLGRRTVNDGEGL
jgi:hypothetical protein